MPATPNRTNLTRGYPVALTSAAVLSTTAIFIRHLTQTYQLPSLVLAFWREFFVALTLAVVLAFKSPALLRVPAPARRLPGGLRAGAGVLQRPVDAVGGPQRASVSTVLVYSSAGFTALLGWWLLKERLGWAKLLVVSLTLGGCVLVSEALDPAAWQVNLGGILTGVISGLLYAVYSLMGRSASQRGLNPWSILLYTFLFAAP